MSKKLKFTMLFALMLVTIIVVAACGGGNSNDGNSSVANQSGGQSNTSPAGSGGSDAPAQEPVSQEPVEFTTLRPYWAVLPDEKGELYQKFEEIMNAKMTNTWVQGPNMMDRVNVALASGNMPDVLVVFQGNQPSIVNAVRQGAFWEVGAYLDDFPNIRAGMDEIRNKNIEIDGKVWALYVANEINRHGFNLRKDWLDEVGLQPPKNMDQLYEVLRAFAKDDPDRNGKDDTYGLFTFLNNGRVEGMEAILAKFGVPNVYGLKDGKLIPAFDTDEYLDGLNFYRKLYNEGIMNKDFTYAKKEQRDEAYNSGRVGLVAGNIFQYYLWEPVLAANPDAEIFSFHDMEGPNLVHASLGYWSTLMFPKSSIPSEERLKEILGAIDRMSDPANKELLTYGIEGVHYKKENGQIARIGEAPQQELNALGVFALTTAEDKKDIATLPDWVRQAEEIINENDRHPNLTLNPVSGLISETEKEIGPELNTLINDATVNYIIGELDEVGFKSQVEKWYTSGGSKVLEELESQL